VGLFDEDFFMFSEETDWCYRFNGAGWEVLFYPGAEVVHVGGGSHGDRLYQENLRGHLRFFTKHRGRREAERAGRLLLWGVRQRGRVRGARLALARAGAVCRNGSGGPAVRVQAPRWARPPRDLDRRGRGSAVRDRALARGRIARRRRALPSRARSQTRRLRRP